MGVLLERFTTPHRPGAFVRALLPRLSDRLLGGPMPARIVSVVPTGVDAAVVTLKVSRRFRPHSPGQFLTIEVDIDGTRHVRCFTITSLPRKRHVELTIQARHDGVVSRYFVDRARRGDLVYVSQPEGEFCLQRETDPILMLSGGSGVTPMLAMLRWLAARQADRDTTAPDVVLIHHATSVEAVLHGEEIAALEAAMPWLRTRIVVTRDQRGLRRSGVHMDEPALARSCPDWQVRKTFACGPHGLIEFTRAAWASAGIEHQLRIEYFGTPSFANVVDDPDAEHTACFSRSDLLVAASGGGTLLDAAESAGLQPPHGCRMGICHGCTTPLREGRARDLRDGSLLAAGSHVQICVSAAASDITLEL
ncbi:MAG: flavin reductase family protein [Microthrixaceae bacterium]